MLSRNLEQSLHRALAIATERRHEYATLEHLLLALSEDADDANLIHVRAAHTAVFLRHQESLETTVTY